MKKIKTAIVGLGNIAHGYEDNPEVVGRIKYPTHLSVLKRDKRFILVGGSDPNSQARKSFGKKVAISVKVYSDYQEMIKTAKPDLVVVATPTGTHVKICKDVIKLGIKNILCEKPIDYSLPDAKSLIQLSKKKKIRLAFNYLRVYDKRYQRLIKLIKDKKFGKIDSIEVKYYKGIYNTATHLISLLEKIFGPVRAVRATTKVSGGQDPNIDFTAEFKDAIADFKSFAGPKPILEIDMRFNKQRIRIVRDKSKDFKLNVGTSILDVYDNLYQFIVGKEKIACSGQEALHTLKVVDAVIKSLKLKKKVSI